MDLLIKIRQAALRGEIDADLFVQLCERLLAHGQVEPVRAVLQARGLLMHHLTVTGVAAPEGLRGPTGPLPNSSLPGQSLLGGPGLSQESWSQSAEGSLVNEPGASHEVVGDAQDAWRKAAAVPEALELNDNVLEVSERLAARSQGESRAPEKYTVLGEIARGGVGAIHMVRDRDLMRRLVMKTLIEGHEVSPYVKAKFVEEAQITAQLEHPNIIPVHDFGYFSGGEIFFTMKLVSGRTLKDIVRALRKSEGDARVEFPLARMLGVFLQVCQAIRFAHSRGVIHRDIKTSNIMLGDFGEVLVLDWGVAKVLARAEAPGAEVATMRSQSEDATMVGIVTGTPAYMSPEQAMGQVDAVDERSDIYALGALLYEVLTWRAPFRGKNFRQILAQVLANAPVMPTERAPENTIPLILEQLAMRCMAKRAEDRPQDVREVIDTVQHYLSGVEDLDRRHRLSQRRLEEGIELIEAYRRTRGRVAELREGLFDLEWQITGWADADRKRELWARQAEVAEFEERMHARFSEAAQALMGAIGFDPENRDAHNELARLYWFRLREAEEKGDEAGVIYHRRLVEAHNRGLFDDLLKGEGRLIVRSEPAGATVTLSRYLEVDLQLTPLMDQEIGRTPLHNATLAHGAWQVTLSLPGYRDVVLPARIERGEVTDLVGRFFTEAELGTHFLQVPAGPFIMGGDDACTAARHRRVVNVDEVLIARYPVTCGEYLAFLRDLDRIDQGRAQARMPRLKARAGLLWARDANGQIALPAVDSEGFNWHPHWPIIGISADDAATFCRWYTQRTGLAVRLPTEPEWEKAARGADGRFYPWGHRFDAGFCHMAGSRPGRPMPDRVGQYPTDRSPYGLLDAAGLVREYCLPEANQGAAERTVVVKGGSYATTSDLACRVTHRLLVPSDLPHLEHGFRLARTPPVVAEAVARPAPIAPRSAEAASCATAGGSRSPCRRAT